MDIDLWEKKTWWSSSIARTTRLKVVLLRRRPLPEMCVASRRVAAPSLQRGVSPHLALDREKVGRHVAVRPEPSQPGVVNIGGCPNLARGRQVLAMREHTPPPPQTQGASPPRDQILEEVAAGVGADTRMGLGPPSGGRFPSTRAPVSARLSERPSFRTSERSPTTRRSSAPSRSGRQRRPEGMAKE